MVSTTLGTRITKFITSKGLTVQAFEKAIGAGNNTIGTSIKRNSNFSSGILSKILITYPELSSSWLLTGKGSMYEAALLKESDLNAYQIPFYNDFRASAGKIKALRNLSSVAADGYIHVPHMPKCDGAVHVVGDSMHPLLKSGDIICYKLKNKNTILYGEMYLVEWHDGDGDAYLMVKYLQKGTAPGCIKLSSYNDMHEDIEIKIEAIDELALVKCSIRFNTN